MGIEYKDYYKVLGIPRNADKETVNRAFKKLARKYHPDLNAGDKEAEAKFKDVNEAHEVLKDDAKRKLYDELGPDWQHGQNFQQPPGFENFRFFSGQSGGGTFSSSGFSDFFETLFGGAGRGQGFGPDPFGSFNRGGRGSRRVQPRGRDVEAELCLSLNEAYKGGQKNVSVSTAGNNKSLDVKIPAGVREGARIRLTGQGEAGGGGQPGDLYLRVRLLPHKDFTLDNNDIIHELNLAPWEAALGLKVRVPTLDGEVDLNIPPGSSGGRKFRLRGRGLGTGATKGDEFVRLNIRLPEKLEPAEKALWEKLAEVSTFKAR
ncbi:MAG: DnaJ domain-containing protein [Deltaproteobacteria bacterium]|jgi:curved DNA-binding protein|nr:DnaJ domain-containing protein [Deltaproteobacteria bacterium]